MTATEWLSGLLNYYRDNGESDRRNLDLVAAIESKYDTLLGQTNILLACGYTTNELVLVRHPDEKITEVLPRSFVHT